MKPIARRSSLRPPVPQSPERFVVRDVLDAVWASQRLIDFAQRSGMTKRARSELAIVLSELVTNAVKFAGTGTVSLATVADPDLAVEVAVEDAGPGIPDPELALLDGYSEGMMMGPDQVATRRGLGSGLSAAKRLSDQLTITNLGPGVRVVARKYVRRGRR